MPSRSSACRTQGPCGRFGSGKPLPYGDDVCGDGSIDESLSDRWAAETAVGEYPIEAVAMMDRIAHRVQQDPLYYASLAASHLEPEHTNRDAISERFCLMTASKSPASV